MRPADPTHRPLSRPAIGPRPNPRAYSNLTLTPNTNTSALGERGVAPAPRRDPNLRLARVAMGGIGVHVMVPPLLCPSDSSSPFPHRVLLQRASLGQPPALPALPGVPQVSVHGHLGLESGLARPALPPTRSSSSPPILVWSPAGGESDGERNGREVWRCHFISIVGILTNTDYISHIHIFCAVKDCSRICSIVAQIDSIFFNSIPIVSVDNLFTFQNTQQFQHSPSKLSFYHRYRMNR